MQQFLIHPPRQPILDRIAVLSAEQASTALSKWFGQTVRIHCDGFAGMPLEQVSTIIDGGESPVAALHMLMAGALSGHILLAFPESTASKLVSILTLEPPHPAAEFDDMARSALCETGNIVASAFVNSLASHLGVRASPTPPTFCFDMGAALIQPLVAEQVEMSAETLYVASTFEIEGQSLDWWLYVVPSPECMQVMVALLH